MNIMNEMNAEKVSGMRKVFSLNNLPFFLLTGLIFLTPIFFTFFRTLSFQFAKSALIYTAIILTISFVIFLIIKNGQARFPKSVILALLMALTAVYFFSAYLSDSPVASFLGYGFETATSFFMLMMLSLTFLVSANFRSPRKILIANFALLGATALLGVFHVARFFWGVDFLSFGLFSTMISNTVGRWSELAIFFGVGALTSLIALEAFEFEKIHRWFFYLVLVVSTVALAVVNFRNVWVALLIIVSCFAIYQFLFARNALGAGDGEEKRRKIPVRALVMIAVILLFVVPIGFIRTSSQNLSTRLGISDLDVRPSFAATYSIFKDTISVSPVLGAGPNRFGTQWQLYRPDINLSNFWNLSFDSGVSFIGTAFVETGLLGSLVWLLFIVSIVYTGLRALFIKKADPLTRYLVASTFFVTLFLWSMNFLYTTGLTILSLSFIFLGLFVAATSLTGRISWRTISFSKKSFPGYVVIVLLVVILLITWWFGYLFMGRLRASVDFQKGLFAANTENNLASAEKFISQAVDLVPHDIYYRSLAELNLLKINNLLSGAANKKEASDAEKEEFKAAFGAAIGAAELAEKRDPGRYENVLIMAKVGEAVGRAGVAGAPETAKAAYEKALKLSPKNPGLYLDFARFEAGRNNFAAATSHVKKALELKRNFVEAIFFQSQIDVATNNISAAIKSTEQVLALAPNDPSLFFRLGLLRYESKDFLGAVESFEKSISLVPVYANARYFLGLSYYRIGRVKEAIKQFEDIAVTNPENKEVKSILANLRAGRDPFASAVVDAKPEKRKKLPVSENN